MPLGVNPQGIDLSTSVENEWLCAQLANWYGLPMARCEIETFGEEKVLVVERFDRRLATDGSWIIRLPQEDLCQATATAPAWKYESDGGPGIAKIMDLLLGSEIPRKTAAISCVANSFFGCSPRLTGTPKISVFSSCPGVPTA